MMNTQLTLTSFIQRAEKYFPQKQIISRTLSGIHRFTYGQYVKRTKRLASALTSLGMEKGMKIGTFAWNHHRHLEAYFAVPCSGAVLHMINIRLSPEHLTYVINHAEDKILLIDEDLIPLIENIQDKLATVEKYIIMTDKQELPETSLSPVYSYEDLLQKSDENHPFDEHLDENAPAGMCYTSATTGNPKGVVYSHRGIYLHSMSIGLVDTLGISERDTCMPVVPMFHANAWGMPFAAVWFGANQVFPGPGMTPAIIAELITQEKVTFTAGVPTIWLGLLKELEKGDYDISSLRALICGGAAAPKSVIRAFENKYHVPFIHGYGMTETSPVATLSTLKSGMVDASKEEIIEVRAKQGLVVPGLDIKIVNENGEVPWDGKTMGELLIRGPWVADEYYKDDRSADAFKDGWLYTGDIAVMDMEGCIKIMDRTKDLIKSGGEWISSVDLENALMSHEAVFEAAVVAVPHEKWQERPVACVVLKDDYHGKVSKDELLEYLSRQFAKWWLPDDVLFMEEIPKTSVGKFLKRALRDQLKEQYSNN
ncbi:long-chain fatty acid--CoA ligase [Falsibacillus albus]|uniref:Fatty-acid--CoA ligase n=1 Tax=Falsibacillus albus TaxID=2478915 RepID=A0A3L7JXP7_9BACI|nr:long-chain fatty acid--CoA ligase [Falsibacillus albus]RLQ95567.1 fatty-acid--CoA ligase [Falsibacillus albus]